MKKYIKPQADLFTINAASLLTDTSMTIGDDLTGGTHEGRAKRRHYNNWEDDMEWEVEEEVTF